MLDKLITADQLKMLSDEEKYAKDSRYFFDAGGEYTDKKFYKILTVSFNESDNWNNFQYLFAFSSRHGGSGFLIINIQFSGDFVGSVNDVNRFDFRLLRSKANLWGGLGLYFNKNTRKLTLIFESYDYSNLRINWLNRQDNNNRLTYEAIQPLDNLPSDIGEKIPMHEALFDDRLVYATDTDVSNLFGGGLINRVLRKLKEVLNYAR